MEETGKNQELDQDEVNAFDSNVWNYKQGEVVSLKTSRSILNWRVSE